MFYDVIYYVYHLVNTSAILDLDDRKVEQIEVMTFLEVVSKYCIRLMSEVGEAISVLVSEENVICLNSKEGLFVVVVPIEYVTVKILWII